jgi:AmmeMemoRadiSam system protein A
LETLSNRNKEILLNLASETISEGLKAGLKPNIDTADYDLPLQEHKACFVTLYLKNSLRGCIGTLEAQQALVNAVVDASHSAAFQDPRFSPLSADEFHALETSISVLSIPKTIHVTDESELLTQLRPGIDGLILEEGSQRGTFLPSVWAQLPEPVDFLAQLKRKAGLPANYWSPSIVVSRYTTEIFSTQKNE